MKLVERMKEAARADVKRIVLPEGDEPRTVKAATILKNEGIAEPILLTKALIEAPSNAARLASYAATLYELRKAKGLTEEKAAALDDLLSEITLEQENAQEGASLSGKTFVVTGAVHIFANRDALKDFIDARGGKVASAVSSKTDYLINNDVTSTSGKNKKAKELNIPVISEEDFMKIAEE